MKVIECYPENMDKRTQFGLMACDNAMKMMTLDGSTVEPEMWIHYTKANNEGEDVEVLTIKTGEEIFSTISPTFIRKFMEIVDFMGADQVGQINVYSAKSKAGRSYISCDLSL